MEKLVGHIASNPNKVRIVELLKSREADIKTISKSTRIPIKMLDKLIEELLNDGIVEEANGIYKLTEVGFNIVKDLKGV